MKSLGTLEIIILVLVLALIIMARYFVKYFNKIENLEKVQSDFKIIQTYSENCKDIFEGQAPYDDSRYNNENREEVLREAQRRHNETIVNVYGYIKQVCDTCGKYTEDSNLTKCKACISKLN